VDRCGIGRRECALANPAYQAAMDLAGEELGRRIATAEFRQLVEIVVIELAEHDLQQVESATDVANDAVGIERLPAQLRLDHKSCSMELLRGPEDSADQAVRDHAMMADGDAVHRGPLSVIMDGVAQYARGRCRENPHKL